MVSGHTPGPWFFEATTGRVVDYGGRTIAFAAAAHEASGENGPVLAAAPDLLRELQALLRACTDPGPMGSVYEITRAASGARDAIAKATGAA